MWSVLSLSFNSIFVCKTHLPTSSHQICVFLNSWSQSSLPISTSAFCFSKSHFIAVSLILLNSKHSLLVSWNTAIPPFFWLLGLICSHTLWLVHPLHYFQSDVSKSITMLLRYLKSMRTSPKFLEWNWEIYYKFCPDLDFYYLFNIISHTMLILVN